MTESDDAFRVEIELAGAKSKDIDVEANGQELLVTGEVDTEKINAQMSDGVLTITVPKAEVAKPRHVEISETSESTESGG